MNQVRTRGLKGARNKYFVWLLDDNLSKRKLIVLKLYHKCHIPRPTYLSSSLQVECKVDTRSRYSALFFSLFSASPHVSLSSFNSFSTVLCQIVFGLPTGRFPYGIHLRAVLVMLDPSILKTCLSHRNLFCVISTIMHLKNVIFSKLVFVMVFANRFYKFIGGSYGGSLTGTSCLPYNPPAFTSIQEYRFNVAVI